MASKKFAHWNGFPFMTAPRTNYYSAQLQSPLFRLPREVRDAIYEQYVLGEDGYHYDSETGKMLYTVEPRQTVRLGLIITCRIAHEELKNMVFRKLHFSAHLSHNDGRSYRGLSSRAGRFQRMLRYVERQKRRILITVFELLQPEDFLDLYTRFPSVKGWFNEPLRQSATQQRDELAGSEQRATQAFSDALQHALVLAKNRNPPEFARLASKTFGARLCPVPIARSFPEFNYFVNGALLDIFSWSPKPWHLPSDVELARLESVMCMPGDDNDSLPTMENGFSYYLDSTTHLELATERWCFSATSIAIDFLREMPQQRRQNLRLLKLNESSKAVSRPASHACGLIPFCLENPKLRVQRRISLFTNLLPDGFSSSLVWHEGVTSLLVSECIRVIMPWIEAALDLAKLGMPADSFQLVIDGTTREACELWKVLKHAAALQEALLEYLRLKGTRPGARPLDPHYTDCWSFPDYFPKVIRDIVEGTSVIMFDGPVGELWDPEVVFSIRKNWTYEQWDQDWQDHVFFYEIPTNFYRDAEDRYKVRPQLSASGRRMALAGLRSSNNTQSSA